MSSIEYLGDGDIASVAVQYSYLNSPLSLLFQPEYGAAASRALFAEIYGYWTKLPKDKRPRLYLHGLSLGAMNSEKSAELFEMIGDPIAGKLMIYDALGSRFEQVKVAWDPENALSGRNATIKNLSIHAGGGSGAVCVT